MFSTNGDLRCDVCNVTISGEIPMQQHLQGAKHRKKLTERNFLESSAPVTPTGVGNNSNLYRCDVCNKEMTGLIPYEQHLLSIKHLGKSALMGRAGTSPRPSVTASSSLGSPPVRLATTPPASNPQDDAADEVYRRKYLKEVVVIEANESIDDKLRGIFAE